MFGFVAKLLDKLRRRPETVGNPYPPPPVHPGPTYQYRVVAVTYDGRDSIPSATGQTTTPPTSAPDEVPPAAQG